MSNHNEFKLFQDATFQIEKSSEPKKFEKIRQEGEMESVCLSFQTEETEGALNEFFFDSIDSIDLNDDSKLN